MQHIKIDTLKGAIRIALPDDISQVDKNKCIKVIRKKYETMSKRDFERWTEEINQA